MKRFRDLTQVQFDVFGQITINNDLGHNRRTLKSLVDAGLIEESVQEIRERGQFPMTIKRYSVPIPVHIEWCQWCADNPLPDDPSEKAPFLADPIVGEE